MTSKITIDTECSIAFEFTVTYTLSNDREEREPGGSVIQSEGSFIEDLECVGIDIIYRPRNKRRSANIEETHVLWDIFFDQVADLI